MSDQKHQAHRIVVCTDCPHVGAPCKPGLELIGRLRAAMNRAAPAVAADFSVEGTVCTESCLRPCRLAFQASAGETHVFGDIAADTDVSLLVSSARSSRGNPAGHALVQGQAMISTQLISGLMQ